MVQYVLYYFNARARAEVIRLLFATAGVPYEDIRLSQEQWAKQKPMAPFGQMPYLEIDGKPHAQSKAIAWYLANEFGLAGKSNLDKLQIGQVMECISDVMQKLYELLFMKDEAKKEEAKKNFKDQVLMPNWKRLEALLQPSGYFVGNSITLADISFYHATDSIHRALGMADKPEPKDHPVPKLAELFKKVEQQEGIAKWLKQRPDSEF